MVARPLKLFAAASLASLAVGTAVALSLQAPITWVVDDDGGPGVDYTSLQTAIDAASEGDLILVKPGSYGDFDLDKMLTILGEPGSRVDVGVVHDIAERATLCQLEFKGLGIGNCTGTVVLDEVWGWYSATNGGPSISVSNSADVRLIDIDRAVTSSSRVPSLSVFASRVELSTSTLYGQDGSNKSTGYAGDGGVGLSVTGGSLLHMSRGEVRGGSGGDITTLIGYGYGGKGGTAMVVDASDVVVTGRAKDLIKGGNGGEITLYGYAGDGGNGLEVKSGGTVRRSRVIVKGGNGGIGYASGNGGSPGVNIKTTSGGSVSTPPLADPFLERLGDAVAGGSVTLRLRTEAGAYSRLFWGFSPVLGNSPRGVVPALVAKEMTIPLGFALSPGKVNHTFPLGPAFPKGTVIYFQAMSIFPGGKIVRTNSVPVVVR